MQVAVDGVVRASEARSSFVPDNNPARGEWYWIDVPKIATACGLPPETPLIEVEAQSLCNQLKPSARTLLLTLCPGRTAVLSLSSSNSALLPSQVYSDEVPGDERGPVPTSMDVLAFKARKPKSAALYPISKSSAELLNVSVTPVDHRNYAITWFTLSGATAFLGARALRKPVRSPRK